MKKLVAIGLSPNTTNRDVFMALKLLIRPWLWYKKSDVENLKEKLNEFLGVSTDLIYPTISGRSALTDALTIHGVSEGDEVIIQAFTCVAVVNAITWVNAKPVYVDIDTNTLNFSIEAVKEKITPKTKAIIVQYTFGLPFPNLAELITFAHERSIIVIEDCAHALGAKIDGQMVGTIADAGIFSFGRDKMISSVFGGALVLNENTNQLVLDKAQRFYKDQNNVSLIWLKQQLLYIPIMHLVMRLYYFISLGRMIHWFGSKIGLLSKATSAVEKACGSRPEWTKRRLPGALAKLAYAQLNDAIDKNKRRAEIAAMYQNEGINCLQDVKSTDTERVWLRYAVVVNDPKKLQLEFKRAGVIIGDWYDQAVAPKEVNMSKAGYVVGSCPNADNVSRQIINLPLQPSLTNTDVERIVEIYKQTNDQLIFG